MQAVSDNKKLSISQQSRLVSRINFKFQTLLYTRKSKFIVHEQIRSKKYEYVFAAFDIKSAINFDDKETIILWTFHFEFFSVLLCHARVNSPRHLLPPEARSHGAIPQKSPPR